MIAFYYFFTSLRPFPSHCRPELVEGPPRGPFENPSTSLRHVVLERREFVPLRTTV